MLTQNIFNTTSYIAPLVIGLSCIKCLKISTKDFLLNLSQFWLLLLILTQLLSPKNPKFTSQKQIWKEEELGPGGLLGKVEKILKGGLDLVSSPSTSLKIQIMGGKAVNKLLKINSY